MFGLSLRRGTRYLDEHGALSGGKYKDQVDASTGAFNKIASKYRYDSTLAWV